MNLDFMTEQNPRYVNVKPKRFVIDGEGYSEIEAFIEDIVPIRKFFEERKLVCYSQDGATGKRGNHCALCRDRFRCRKRLRLMLMVQNAAKKPLPAILEVNSQSFDALQAAVKRIEPDELPSTLVNMTVDENENGALTVAFKTLF